MDQKFFLQEMLNRYNILTPLANKIEESARLIINSYRNGGKVLVCGNGGSCSDSDHIVGELMKSFEGYRPLDEDLKLRMQEVSPERGAFLSGKLQQGLPAISLTAHNALITAVSNDLDGEVIFAQQVTGYGNAGDVLIGLSSSGNSQDVLDAMIVAKAKGLKTIGLTGATGGKMKAFCDVLINVPEKRTAYVQELHLPVYHAICMMVESEMFKVS